MKENHTIMSKLWQNFDSWCLTCVCLCFCGTQQPEGYQNRCTFQFK